MAAKLKDGLFIGDADTSQDVEFLELNKISNLVNLSGGEVPNAFAASGLVYLSLPWTDSPSCPLFEAGRELATVQDLADFIDTSLRHGISVLLFSKRGLARCTAAAALYLMAKYRWSFEKAFEFIQAKKPDVELNKGFIQQLFAIDKLLSTQREAALASNGQLLQLERLRASSWDKSYLLQQQSEEDEKKKKNTRKTYSKLSDFDDDELVLVNSFLNGKLTISSLPGPYLNQPPKKDFDIRFNDTVLQEDVHVFPTSPVEKTSVPIRGAMKGSRDKHRQQAQAKACRTETSLEEKKKGEEKEEDAFQRRRLSSSFSSSLLASSSSMESKQNDLYDLVGLSSSSSSFTRLQQSSAAKGGGVHSSSAKGNGEALTLEELAKGTAASIGPSSSSSKPPQMTRRAAASDGFAALQRSGVVRAAADEDMPLSDLLFHVNSTTDYESYRRSLSNRADSLRNSGGGGGGSSHSTGMTSSNSSSSSRDRVKGAWTETNTPSSTTKPSSSSSSLRTSAPQRSSSPLVRQQSLLSVTSSVSSNDYYDNNSKSRVPKTYRRGSPAPRSATSHRPNSSPAQSSRASGYGTDMYNGTSSNNGTARGGTLLTTRSASPSPAERGRGGTGGSFSGSSTLYGRGQAEGELNSRPSSSRSSSPARRSVSQQQQRTSSAPATRGWRF